MFLTFAPEKATGARDEQGWAAFRLLEQAVAELSSWREAGRGPPRRAFMAKKCVRIDRLKARRHASGDENRMRIEL